MTCPLSGIWEVTLAMNSRLAPDLIRGNPSAPLGLNTDNEPSPLSHQRRADSRTEEAGSCISPVAYDYCPQLSIRTRTYHPMIQGKIERYFQSMKNVILLDIYYSPEELKARIGEWVDYYS